MNINEKFSLNGKVAIVTGGLGILGGQFCKGLVDSGARVAIVDIAPREEVSAAICLDSYQYFQCDITKKESVVKCIAEIMDMFSKIDILVNNAATKTSEVPAFFATFEDYTLETWSEVMSVNVDGMFLMAQAVGKHMLTSGGGVIVQVASIYGLVGPDQRIYEGSNYLGGPINTPAVYSASKAAVVGFTKWLSTYWADKGIRVNCIVPGGVSSGQNEVFENNYSSKVPMGRMARKDELVPALIYLSSDASSYVTGHVLSVDGGWTAW